MLSVAVSQATAGEIQGLRSSWMLHATSVEAKETFALNGVARKPKKDSIQKAFFSDQTTC